jgi:hypothetical protein
MHKALGTALAAFALTMTSLQAASAANTANFSVSATVSTIASLTFGSPTFTNYSFGTITDNTNPAVPATNNAAAVINANMRTTATSGTGSIFFTAPSTVAGTGANSIPIGAFTYTCSGNYTENTGVGGAQNTVPVSVASTTVVSPAANNCVPALGAGKSVASSAITLAMFLDDRFIAADTYSQSGFQVVVSAT